MNEKQVRERLLGILKNTSHAEYPELHFTIENLLEQTGCDKKDAFSTAEILHDADGAKELPKCVSDLLFDIYNEELLNGNAEAACNMGSLYYTGRCGTQSYKKALEYYTMAAEGGSRCAQENLGYCYYYGRNTETDYEKAFHYFALGAFDGHLRSLYKIGDMYKNGYYVEKNEKEAFYIYQRCMQELTEEAQVSCGGDIAMRLGDCFFKGIGTEVDLLQALRLYQISEHLLFERLQNGDFMIKGCYNHVVEKQTEIRKKLAEQLPDFSWTKKRI